MSNRVECIVHRGVNEESRHEINCVVIDEKNNIIFECGDIRKPYCLRSTLKPFQCAASIEHGTTTEYNFTQKEIAITCASHHGEKQHATTVSSILEKIKLNDSDLECGFHFPLDKKSKSDLHSDRVRKTNIYNNCSGKHAGLLAFIKKMNYSTKNYIKHTHPIHKHIEDYIVGVAGMPAVDFAIDGCSLPTPYFNLITLAKMYMRLITSKEGDPLNQAACAMRENPDMVSGTKGFDTFFMKYFKNNGVSKGGAEGMQALSLKTTNHGNISLALKVSDGSHRGNYISCIKILRHIDAINNSEYCELMNFIGEKQKNLNKITTGKLVCNIS